jgi:transposase
VCVQDAGGTVVARGDFAASAAGLAALVAWLRDVCGEALAGVGVVLEVPRGPVVDTLVAAGCQVFMATPKRVVRMREQVSEAGAKDDRRDAQVLATPLRLLPEVCRRIVPEPAAVVVLRAQTRLRAELTATRTQLLQRLRAELRRYYPQLLDVARDLGQRWVWDLWQLVPEPALAAAVTAEAIGAVLAAGGARRRAPATVLAALRAAGFPVAAGVVTAARLHIATLLAQLRVLAAEQQRLRAALPAQLRAATGALGVAADADVVRSLPGVGPYVAGVLVAEAGPLLAARDYARLRLEAGVGPVTVQSGRSTAVRRRYAHNRRLAVAVYHLARIAMVSAPPWRERYRALRARGHGHARALRTLADRLLAILCAMLRRGTEYDPTPCGHAVA